MLTVYIIEFLIFSFVGWLIDSGYQSICERRWVNAGYLKAFICPSYGIGGLVLVFFMRYFQDFPLSFLFLIGTLGTVAVEYFSGVFTENVLRVRLWDYSKSRFHLGGHIDLLHSFYWFVLTVVFTFFIYPLVVLFETVLVIPDVFDLPVLLVFVVGILWLIAQKHPSRFLDIKGKFIDMSVQEYKHLFSNIQQMYAAPSSETRRKLREMITKQLKNTGAYLKKIRFEKGP